MFRQKFSRLKNLEKEKKNIEKKEIFSFLNFFLALNLFSSCTLNEVEENLSKTSEFEHPRGLSYRRVLIHTHSVLSHDACDADGGVDGLKLKDCLADLKRDFCRAGIDAVFLTDHPDGMALNAYDDLFLNSEGSGSSRTVQSCDGNSTILYPGFENEFMGLALDRHLAEPSQVLLEKYQEKTKEFVDELRAQTGAFVAIPHTESRTDEFLLEIEPDFIEIYNLHANMDPQIRPSFLKLDPYGASLKWLPYMLDPLKRDHPDLAMLSVFHWSDVYIQKWKKLWEHGLTVYGTAGTDAHQNIFPGKAADGERLDSFRRFFRWINHLFIMSPDDLDYKSALARGDFFVHFEFIGTASNFDLGFEISENFFNWCSTNVFSENIEVFFKFPKVLGFKNGSTEMEFRLINMLTGETIKRNTEEHILIEEPGIYRAEFWMNPTHLKDLTTFDNGKNIKLTPWLVSQPCRLSIE